MDMSKYTGNPTGKGNPPGEYKDAYTSDPGRGESNFNEGKSYRSDMHVGMPNQSKMVGNQPKESKSSELLTNNPALR